MILRPQQIALLRLGRPVVLANGGSDSDSQANTTSTTQNTNYVTNTDKRIVASDAAVAINGSGNAIDRSTSNLTSFNDNSDRSSTSSNLTSFLDLSDRSTKTTFTDNSNRSTSSLTSFLDTSTRDSNNTTTTNIRNTSSDFGSVSAALSGMDKVSRAAIEVADHSIGGAISSLKNTSDNNLSAVMAAFMSAGQLTKQNAELTKDVMGFASSTIANTGTAFSKAAYGPDSENNKAIMLGLLAVVGVIGVSFALKG